MSSAFKEAQDRFNGKSPEERTRRSSVNDLKDMFAKAAADQRTKDLSGVAPPPKMQIPGSSRTTGDKVSKMTKKFGEKKHNKFDKLISQFNEAPLMMGPPGATPNLTPTKKKNKFVAGIHSNNSVSTAASPTSPSPCTFDMTHGNRRASLDMSSIMKEDTPKQRRASAPAIDTSFLRQATMDDDGHMTKGRRMA